MSLKEVSEWSGLIAGIVILVSITLISIKEVIKSQSGKR